MSALAVRAIRIFTIGVIPLAVQYVVVDSFTGMGMVQYALPLSMFRKVVYFIALFVLPALGGGEAAFCAETVSDLLPGGQRPGLLEPAEVGGGAGPEPHRRRYCHPARHNCIGYEEAPVPMEQALQAVDRLCWPKVLEGRIV